MINIKCNICGTDISILENMTSFACPKCRTVQNRQVMNEEISNQEIPMAIPVEQEPEASQMIREKNPLEISEKKKSVKQNKLKKLLSRGIAILVIVLLFVAIWNGESIADICNTYQSINKIKKAETGNTVVYGMYPMTESGDKLGIEWIVADKKDGKVLLVSKYYLDILEYYIHEDVVLNFSWKKSELRDWLNKEFWNKAFSDSEKWRITESLVKSYSKNGNRVRTYDHVFVVSYEEEEEIKNLNEELTEYAYDEAFRYSDNPTYHTFFPSYEFLGEYIEDGFRTFAGDREGCLVRPAIWVDYKSIIP